MKQEMKQENKKEMKMKIKLILAQDANFGIGYKGILPWPQCNEDLKLFKLMTMGSEKQNNAVIMGYDTWISLPDQCRPLRGRTNIVLSSNHYNELIEQNKCIVFDNWENLKNHLLQDIYDEAWIIGGSSVYRGAIEKLPITDVIRTTFKETYKCDRFIDIDGLFKNKGVQYQSYLISDTPKFFMEHLEVKQRVVS